MSLYSHFYPHSVGPLCSSPFFPHFGGPLCSSHLFWRPVSVTLAHFSATAAATSHWEHFRSANLPLSAPSADLHDGGYGVLIGLSMLPHVPILFVPNITSANLFSSALERVLLQLMARFHLWHDTSLAHLPLKFGAILTPYASTSFVNRRFRYCLFCDFGHCAVHFWRVLRCCKEFSSRLCYGRLFLVCFLRPRPSSCRSYSGKELSGCLFCLCPLLPTATCHVGLLTHPSI